MPSVENCPECPYGGPAIGPRGNPASPIAIVGEAPGKTEIEMGYPFVGPAGAILSRAIAEAGLQEADLFITNAVACRPQPVRPKAKAIEACRGRLMRELEAHPRAVVVALGATALRAITGQQGLRILEARGQAPIATRGWLVVSTIHPALVLRRPDEFLILEADLTRARLLAETGQPMGPARSSSHGRSPI